MKFENILLTDAGLETSLIYKYGLKLRNFAAFEVINKREDVLRLYYTSFLNLAIKYKTDFILESPTWRANLEQGEKLGYTREQLFNLNKQSIYNLKKLRREYNNRIENIFISGCIGPRKDAYNLNEFMSVNDAEEYHNLQIQAFKESGTDFATALTINNSNEALGIVKSTMKHNLPVIISFTTGMNGKLITNQSLNDAIKFIDNKTNNYPLHYMINCSHPSHFTNQLEGDHIHRIKGIRANASDKSHEDLDNSNQLYAGDKHKLSQYYKSLNNKLNLEIIGGCCGTDFEHINSICKLIL